MASFVESNVISTAIIVRTIIRKGNHDMSLWCDGRYTACLYVYAANLMACSQIFLVRIATYERVCSDCIGYTCRRILYLYFFLNAKNVTKNGFKFEEMQFITSGKDKSLRKGRLKRADVVLTTRGSVGQFAYFSEGVPYDNIRINSGMVVLRIKTKKVSSEYLYTFCKSETYGFPYRKRCLW